MARVAAARGALGCREAGLHRSRGVWARQLGPHVLKACMGVRQALQPRQLGLQGCCLSLTTAEARSCESRIILEAQATLLAHQLAGPIVASLHAAS